MSGAEASNSGVIVQGRRFRGNVGNPGQRQRITDPVSELRIHFTSADLGRTRMVAGLGPKAETLFALDLFRRDVGLADRRWRRQVRSELGERARDVIELATGCRPLVDLLWLVDGQPPGPVPQASTHRRVRVTMFDFSRIAVVPYWTSVRGRLEAERDTRARVAISRGAESLFGTLHPSAHWDPPVLELPGGPDQDVYLDGEGIVLSPSVFLAAEECVVLRTELTSGRPALVFPVPRHVGLPRGRSGVPVKDDQALPALVGHTRAAALEVLTDSCTTGELSTRLGLSPAGASKHASVLRRAGLVSTARNRNTALHSLTPLGRALIRAGEAEPADEPVAPLTTHDRRAR